MIWNKINAKSVVPLHEYICRDVYNTHQLRVKFQEISPPEQEIDSYGGKDLEKRRVLRQQLK